MAISDDEDTAMHAMSDNEENEEQEVSSTSSLKAKAKAADAEPPQALPGALHGHELDNLPWYIVISLFNAQSSLVRCPA
jgi:hypothetical protein